MRTKYLRICVGLEGNSAADQEAKRGSTMPQSTVPSATAALKRHQQSIAEDRYLSDPRARVHRVFTGSEHSYQRWQRDWPRDQCVTVAQVRTGHSPLVAVYLHRIACRDSAICPHCHSADETVEHLVFQCPAHEQARRDTWPGDTSTTDTRRLWSYLERIGAVTRPRSGMRERDRICLQSITFGLSTSHLIFLFTLCSQRCQLSSLKHHSNVTCLSTTISYIYQYETNKDRTNLLKGGIAIYRTLRWYSPGGSSNLHVFASVAPNRPFHLGVTDSHLTQCVTGPMTFYL